jgi:peroxiredoxin
VACGSDDDNGDDGAFGVTDWPDRAETGPELGNLAPNFRLETTNGEEITLAQLTGASPIVVNFFATWCPSCREEMDIFEAAHGQGVTILGVDLREDADRVQKLADETGVTYSLALDHDGTVTRAYRVTNLPVTYILDPAGHVSAIIRGPVTAETLADAVAAAANNGEEV